jgi:hypothetical protein
MPLAVREAFDDSCPGPVEVILFVTSPSLATASENLRLSVTQLYGDRVNLTLHDSDVPRTVRNAADATRARTRILGHVTSPALLLELLAECARN